VIILLLAYAFCSSYLANAAGYQAFDKHYSVTINKTSIFQIKREPAAFFEHGLSGPTQQLHRSRNAWSDLSTDDRVER
jgi:hypothetical protein